jgi:hypothetical protein
MDELKAAPPSPAIKPIDDGNSTPSSPQIKEDHGIVLIPCPSDDPRDPLVGFQALHQVNANPNSRIGLWAKKLRL